MGMTTQTISLPWSDCLLLKSELHTITPINYEDGGALRRAVKVRPMDHHNESQPEQPTFGRTSTGTTNALKASTPHSSPRGLTLRKSEPSGVRRKAHGYPLTLKPGRWIINSSPSSVTALYGSKAAKDWRRMSTSSSRKQGRTRTQNMSPIIVTYVPFV